MLGDQRLHRDNLHRKPRYQFKLSVMWLVSSEHSFVYVQILQSFILYMSFVQQIAASMIHTFIL